MILANRTLPLNCLLGGLALMACLPSARLSWLRRKGRAPHFYVTDQAGTRWHFRRRCDLLPDPLRWVLFIGRFEAVSKRT